MADQRAGQEPTCIHCGKGGEIVYLTPDMDIAAVPMHHECWFILLHEMKAMHLSANDVLGNAAPSDSAGVGPDKTTP